MSVSISRILSTCFLSVAFGIAPAIDLSSPSTPSSDSVINDATFIGVITVIESEAVSINNDGKTFDCGVNHVGRVEDGLKGEKERVAFFSVADFFVGGRYVVFLGATDQAIDPDDLLYYRLEDPYRKSAYAPGILAKCISHAHGLSPIEATTSRFGSYKLFLLDGKKALERWVELSFAFREVPQLSRVVIRPVSFTIDDEEISAAEYCAQESAAFKYPLLSSPCYTVLVPWLEYRTFLSSKISRARHNHNVDRPPADSGGGYK